MTENAVVYLVDDDADARESVAAVVRSRGLTVREFDSAENFLASNPEDSQACLLIDVRMPGMSGLELQQHLNTSGQSIPTIVITGFGDIATAVKAMQNGAITFLEKPCEQEELWKSIELALHQATEKHKTVQRKQELQERFAKLTGSEREVLHRVMEGQPNKFIATEMDLGLRTIELRRSNITRKTGANSFTELIRMAVEAEFPLNLPAAGKEEESAESKEMSPASSVETEPQSSSPS